MPTTTWATARQEIVRPFGLVTGTVSAALEADTALVDEDLADAYSSNDFFNNKESAFKLLPFWQIAINALKIKILLKLSIIARY